MNTIDLKTVLPNKDGEPSIAKIAITQDDGRKTFEERTATLGNIIEHVCIKQDNITDEALILERYKLFKKVYKADSVDVTDKELKLIKQLVGETYDIFFAGTILSILNSTNEKV